MADTAANGSVDPTEEAARNARMLAAALNNGVLQDAVEAGLEEQGPFTIDELSVLDALASAGLKLVRDDTGEASQAYTALLRNDPS